MAIIPKGAAFAEDPRDGDCLRRCLRWQEQLALGDLADHLGLGETETQKLFTRWAGISPKPLRRR